MNYVCAIFMQREREGKRETERVKKKPMRRYKIVNGRLIMGVGLRHIWIFSRSILVHFSIFTCGIRKRCFIKIIRKAQKNVGRVALSNFFVVNLMTRRIIFFVPHRQVCWSQFLVDWNIKISNFFVVTHAEGTEVIMSPKGGKDQSTGVFAGQRHEGHRRS